MVKDAVAPVVRISTVSAPAPVARPLTRKSTAEVRNTSVPAVACKLLPPPRARPKALAALTPMAPPAFKNRSAPPLVASTAPAVSRIAPLAAVMLWAPAPLKVLMPGPWKITLRVALRSLVVVMSPATTRSSAGLCTSIAPVAVIAVPPLKIKLPLAPTVLVKPTVDKLPPWAAMVWLAAPSRVPAASKVTSPLASKSPARLKLLLSVRLPALTTTSPLMSIKVGLTRVRLPLAALLRESMVRVPLPSVPARRV